MATIKDIKPCPVCGAVELVYPIPGGPDGPEVRCVCNVCGLNEYGPGFATDSEAIEQWNQFVTTKRSTRKTGDILTTCADVLAHQVNGMGVMGAGLAKQVKEKYPEVYAAYHKHCKEFTAKDLLGTTLFWPTNMRQGPKVISNCFGQTDFGVDGVKTDYDALRHALEETVANMQCTGMRSIAIPVGIGCGLAGGDWSIVKNIIAEVFQPTNIFVELWSLPKKEGERQ